MGLGHTLPHIGWPVGTAAQEYAVGGEVQRSELDVRLQEEAVLVHWHLEQLRQVRGIGLADQRGGQDNQVAGNVQRLAQQLVVHHHLPAIYSGRRL